MSDGREALTLADLTAELVATPTRPTRSHRARGQVQRRQARKRTPAPAKAVCGYCSRPALPDRYVCQQHADRLAAIAEQLKALRRPQRKPKGEDA